MYGLCARQYNQFLAVLTSTGSFAKSDSSTDLLSVVLGCLMKAIRPASAITGIYLVSWKPG